MKKLQVEKILSQVPRQV